MGIPEPPGTTAIAAGLSKTFHLTERMRLRFESTFTNLLNHSTFATPPTNVTPRPSALSKAFNRRRTAEIERAKFPCVWTFEDLASVCFGHDGRALATQRADRQQHPWQRKRV